MNSKLPLEIERKFLIAYPDTAALAAMPGCRVWQITQVYLKSADGEEVRVRRRAEGGRAAYTKTVKRSVDALTRVEIETEITAEQYEALLQSADPARRPLTKTRYCVPVSGLIWEIDVYPFWQDRAIAEVELHDVQQEALFPGFIRMIAEVTGDPAYKNAALAEKNA